MQKEEEVPDAISDSTRARWQAILESSREDPQFVERHRLRDATRTQVHPQIRELIEGFVSGQTPLEEFRETFDRRSRNEWDVFGLKGFSAAMFLNQVVKNVKDQVGATAALRTSVAVPADDADARAKIDSLMAFVRLQLDRGASPNHLKPNYAPTFLSACWHAQRPDRWPTMYQSARNALRADGVIGRKTQGADGYLEFASAFSRLANELSISFWDLEHVCVKADQATEAADEEQASLGDTDHGERVWLVSPGPSARMFDEFYERGEVGIGWGEIGDLAQYDDLEQISKAIRATRNSDASPILDSNACHQFVHEMEVGDVVFAKKGRREIVGYGVVTSEYRYEPSRGAYPNVRAVQWRKRGNWKLGERVLVTKTLTDIGKNRKLVAELFAAAGAGTQSSVDTPPPPLSIAAYSIEQATQEIFAAEAQIRQSVELLRYKKNLVLQGPPGTGKTFFAKRLAYLLMEEKDKERVMQVQFHQSYSYEDFVQGYRPSKAGHFARTDGVFLKFCELALQDQSQPYVFIIDEINRGNLSKVLGEMMLLIEADKRDETWAARLTYDPDGEPFYVPPNVHIIGTMNTADRSLAMVDYALRRRFVFVELSPGFEQPAFRARLDAVSVSRQLADRIVARVGALNVGIRDDASLGEGFTVGHSYFCAGPGDVNEDEWYCRIVRTELAPLLREYWFDNRERAEEAIGQLLVP